MEEILTTDYSQQVIGKVNTNFGSVVVSADDCATEATAAMNTAFAGTSGVETLSPADYADDFVETLNDNFDLYDDEPQPEDVTFRFLHVSDPHGYASSTTKAKEMLANDADLAFLFVTGDVTAYGQNNGINSNISSDFTAIGDKLLLLAGNHDTYDNKFGTSGSSQQATTNYIKNWLGQRVAYGDMSGIASYWHKDIQLSESSKLRIISMDQYEIDNVRRGTYHTMYSQAQVDWLIGLLKGLLPSDYVIIATHEPPVQSPAVPSGQSGDTYPDDYAVAMRPSTSSPEAEKLFVTEGLRAFGNRRNEPSMNLLPQIMAAYMSGSVLTMTYNNYNGNASNPDITINEDFSGINPATFLFYLGGHRHADIAYYLPDESQAGGGDWSDQLMLYITCGDVGINYQYDDDLGGTASSVTPKPTNTDTYRINEVELNFTKQTITVTREGAKNTAGGRVRSSVTFPFEKS